ncbi:transposase [Porphyromonas macacae]|uniref:transposase n=1 Tax=Porphyromonas macacae TaxID=28115 RepID=UPI002934D9C8|nr:transposase [Porphyromonas macacae]
MGAVCERLYGHHYSKQQVNFLSNTSKAEIYKWLERKLSPHYLAVYIDATFAFTWLEDSVSKEAYYTMPGLLPDGRREVLCVMNLPQRER